MNSDLVLIADPRVIKIPILETHEPLVDLKNQSVIQFGPSPEIENNQAYTKVRESVYLRLKDAQQLLPRGMFLCLKVIDLQQMLFLPLTGFVNPDNCFDLLYINYHI